MTDQAIGTIQEDPTAQLAPGQVLSINALGMRLALEIGRSEGLFPSTLFQGALLTMMFRDPDGDHATGSAILVAPGIAICAHHVIADFEDSLRAGTCDLLCAGLAGSGAILWLVRSVVSVPGTDLAMLCMTLASAWPAKGQFVLMEMTTRTPAVGEQVALYGLPARIRTTTPTDGISDSFLTAKYTSGRVLAVHHDGRDRVMLPGPCFSVSCNAYGGMSGGPVFDARGCLVGIVSTSYEGDAPLAYVSHVWPALKTQTFPVWPARRPFPPLSLIEMKTQLGLVHIDRPEAITVHDSGSNTHQYTPWS